MTSPRIGRDKEGRRDLKSVSENYAPFPTVLTIPLVHYTLDYTQFGLTTEVKQIEPLYP